MFEASRDIQALLWVGVGLAMGLLELTSLDFFFAMLVGAALASAGVAFAGFGLTVQAITFAVTSVVGLVVVRPLLKRWAQRSAPEQPTNTDALIGRPAVVLQVVDQRSGQVKLVGETWSARSARSGLVLPVDTDVVVLRIDGATAVVDLPPAAPLGPA